MRDFEGTLRHLPFFEALGKMDEKDPNWRSISAGLLVLRLFDAWIAEGSTVVDDGSWSLSGVLEAIDAVDQRVPARRILEVGTFNTSDVPGMEEAKPSAYSV